ncbi:MAG: TM2 domain-containing protein [Thermostichus sp. DG02_2_bins_29]
MGEPPVEDSQSYLFNLTISGSRQKVLQGLRAWLDLGLLTPEQFRSLVRVYQLHLEEEKDGQAPAKGGIPAEDSVRRAPTLPVRIGSAYLLWGLALFGFCGAHRFYLGRWRTGLLWLLTLGLLGVGQLIDLLLIPGMVREKNAALLGSAPQPSPAEPAAGIQSEPLASTPVPVVSSQPSWASRLLQNLLAELSVRWLLVLGLFLVVVSSGVLAGGQWQHFSPLAQYGVLLTYTAAFAAGAWWAYRQEGLRLTGQALETLALLLLPVNVWALDSLRIPWGMRGVALGLLLGIPLVAWGRVRSAGVGYAFYATLVNFLALAGLQTLWGLGPLGITYVGIASTVAYTWSRRLPALRGSKLWLLGAAGSLLVLRGLLTGQVQLWQLGLAVALLGWLVETFFVEETFFEVPGIPQTSPESAPESSCGMRFTPALSSEAEGLQSPESSEMGSLPLWVAQGWQWAGWVLLGLGWLLALAGVSSGLNQVKGTHPWVGWQLLAISLLGIHIFWRRLSQGRQVLDLALLFGVGLETTWALWQVVPWGWRQTLLQVLQREFGWPGSLLGIVLLPYGVLWLSWAARWQRREPSQTSPGGGSDPCGWNHLVQPTERLVLGLGGSLLLLSLANGATRFGHLFLGTGTLAGWWWYQSRLRRVTGDEEAVENRELSLAHRPFWVVLTHAYGVAALLAGLRWLLPDLPASGWGVMLLLLALLEWVGRVVLHRRRFTSAEESLGVWQQSADGLGLVLALLSYGTFLGQRFPFLPTVPEDKGDVLAWLWLLVPLVLTGAEVLALPPLAFMPPALRIPEAETAPGPEGSLPQQARSWREGIPCRDSLESLAIVSILLAQLLTFETSGGRLLGLGLGTLLMATQVWLRPCLAYGLLTVALGLGFALAAVEQTFQPTGVEWGSSWAALVLGLSLCRYPVKQLAARLQGVYQTALDGWSGVLGGWLLLWSSGLLFNELAGALGFGREDSSFGADLSGAAHFAASLSLALLLLLLAFGVHLGLEVTQAGILGSTAEESETARVSRTESFTNSPSAIARVDLLLYGMGWALELLLVSTVLGLRQGSIGVSGSEPLSILPVLAAVNLGLGILFWIGPEQILFAGRVSRRESPDGGRGQLSSLWSGPLIYAGLGWLGSHAQGGEFASVGSLGLSIVLLGLGRRERIPLLQELPLVNWEGLLGASGISLAAYEGWIDFLSHGGAFGDGLVLGGLVGLSLALVYRLCPLWVVDLLRLEAAWLARIAAGNWSLASLMLVPALGELSGAGKNLWLLTGAGLAAYAAWQGRKPSLSSESEPSPPPIDNASSGAHPAQVLWCYLSACQGAGILAVAVQLWLPQVDLWVWGGSLACGLGLVYSFLPWQRWRWWPDPWQNTALVLPMGILLVTATQTTSSNLLLGAAYYAFLSIRRSQVRLGYVSLFLSNWILLDYIWQQEWSSLSLSALPLLGSLLYVAQVDPGLQKSSARQKRHWLRSFSSGALVLVTLLETQGQLWAGFWPVILGLALGLLGLALQVRAYLFVGTVGFGLGVLRQGWLLAASYSFLLWGLGILSGFLLIGVAANFEQRRAQLGAWLNAWLEQLQNWE